ncbi:MAG: protein translocase subunit SecD [Planctomycetota bacterium]|nr:protein translocase subunit SecD [Planctomycetota bacterium]
MFRDFGWKFWVIGLVVAVIIGIPVIAGNWVQLGLDLQGGTMLTYGLDTETASEFDVVLQVLRKRLNTLGLRQLLIRREGTGHFVVQVPGVDDTAIARIKHLIETSGQLWFKIEAVRQEAPEIRKIFEWKQRDEYEEDYKYDIGLKVNKEGDPLPAEDWNSYSLLINKGAVEGRLLSGANPTTDDFGADSVGFQFNAEGARAFGKLTEENKGKNLAIVLDGVVVSAPLVKDTITSSGIITGSYTRDEVNDLVIILQGGSLPSTPTPESDLTIGPGLGRDSIERGKLATWISLALVIGFILVYYRGAGVVACITLLLNLALLVCVLINFEATLTLPGIAGIVLTVGMAIDANILIFERIREEKNKGMGIRQAIENGYGRAFWTIFDANLTTLITALILFQVGTGPIKGFAVTLSIGILTSMFSALFVTKALFGLLVVKGWITEFKIMSLVGEPNIQFGRYGRLPLIVSLALILGGMAVFAARGQDKYGIEFTGGALFQIKLKEPVSDAEVRRRLNKAGGEFVNAEVQAVGFRQGAVAEPSNGGGNENQRALPGEEGYEYQIRVRLVQEGKDVDTNVLKSRVDDAFKDVLAPDTYPPLPPRDAVQMDPSEPGWGKLALVVRLDPRMVEMPDLEKLAADLIADGFEGAEVEPWEDDSGVLAIKVTTGLLDLATEKKKNDKRDLLRKFFNQSVDYPISEPYSRVIDIGKSVAYNLKSKAILAMIFAVFAIVLYITFRFEFKFGIAAITALVHDVLFSMGAVAAIDASGLMDVKIDLAMVTAFLTIIGYSLNDTIVVFDRIRENLGGREKLEYAELVNRSINQTLSRTVLTSITTFVALLALFLAGVNVIRDFSFAMMIGVVVGTYSSIFIASPVLIFLRNREVAAEEREKAQGAKS